MTCLLTHSSQIWLDCQIYFFHSKLPWGIKRCHFEQKKSSAWLGTQNLSHSFLYIFSLQFSITRLMIVPLGVSKKISVDSASLVVLISIIYSVPVMQTGPSHWLHGVETQVPVWWICSLWCGTTTRRSCWCEKIRITNLFLMITYIRVSYSVK